MFKIPKSETAVASKLFAFSLVIAASYVASRTVADSLFLSQVGSDQLALVYVIAGFGTAIVAGAWYALTRKFSVTLSIQFSSIAFAVLSLMAWFWLPAMKHSFWMLASIYLLAEVKGCINAINIVSALNTKLGRDASKSSWAFVGLAAPIAAMVIGGVLAAESQVLTARDWLMLIAGADVVACGLGIALTREASVKQKLIVTQGARSENAAVGAKAKRYVSATKFQKWIGILICTQVIVLTIVSFEWKASASSFFHGRSEQLIRYFGIYYSVVGVLTIGFQILLTSRLLVRRDFRIPLLLMPICVSLFAGLFFFGAAPLVLLSATTGAKAMDSWRRSIYDTSVNLLYTKIKRDRRRDVISINSAIVKPISEVAAASAIYFGSLQFHRPLLMFSIVIWIIAASNLAALAASVRLAKPERKTRRSPNSRALRASGKGNARLSRGQIAE